MAGGKLERYRDQQMGSLVLSFDPQNVSEVCNYLDRANVVWHNYVPLAEEQRQEEEDV